MTSNNFKKKICYWIVDKNRQNFLIGLNGENMNNELVDENLFM